MRCFVAGLQYLGLNRACSGRRMPESISFGLEKQPQLGSIATEGKSHTYLNSVGKASIQTGDMAPGWLRRIYGSRSRKIWLLKCSDNGWYKVRWQHTVIISLRSYLPKLGTKADDRGTLHLISRLTRGKSRCLERLNNHCDTFCLARGQRV
jgi:hypothetical protein